MALQAMLANVNVRFSTSTTELWIMSAFNGGSPWSGNFIDDQLVFKCHCSSAVPGMIFKRFPNPFPLTHSHFYFLARFFLRCFLYCVE